MPRPQRHVSVYTRNRRRSIRVARAAAAITCAGCLGPCDPDAHVVVYPEGVLYSGVTATQPWLCRVDALQRHIDRQRHCIHCCTS